MKVRREARLREKEALGASSAAGPSSRSDTPAASTTQAKRKRGESKKSRVIMVEGKLPKHDGMTIKITEEENKNRVITEDQVIQELKAIVFRKGQEIPPWATLDKAGDITRTLVNSDERRLADRLELIVDWVDRKKDVEWRKSADNRTWEESFKSVVREQGEEYMEEMTEFTLEDKEILDYIALNFIPMAPESSSSMNKVVELILEWQHHEIDRGNKTKQKFAVKVGVDSNGVFKWLHMDRFGQMFSYTPTGIIRYVEDKSGDERTRDWLKQERFQRRVETAKIRRSDKYLKGQIEKAGKTFESDDAYEISGGEMQKLIGVIRSMEDLSEKEFSWRLGILQEFCKLDSTKAEMIPEDETLKSDIINLTESDVEDEVEPSYYGPNDEDDDDDDEGGDPTESTNKDPNQLEEEEEEWELSCPGD